MLVMEMQPNVGFFRDVADTVGQAIDVFQLIYRTEVPRWAS